MVKVHLPETVAQTEKERKMDDEMEEFVTDNYGDDEIDMDYEFDAPKFYDFSRPEYDWEASDAEDWFRFVGSCPPSPFTIKMLNWKKSIQLEAVKSSDVSKDVEGIIRDSDSNNSMEAQVSPAAVDDNNSMEAQESTPKPKPKSPNKSPPLSRSSTFMKPTASQLAKQNRLQQVHSNRSLRRAGKMLGKFEEKSRNSPSNDSLCTKRQKLDTGYVRKAAELKHQNPLLHKAPKKVGADNIARPKVTVPKEPKLVTANRAQRRRYKVNAKPGEQAKIRKAPPSPTSSKSTAPAAEFQEFRLRTSPRAVQETVNNVTNRPNFGNLSQSETSEIKGPKFGYASKKERSEMIYKCAACSFKNKESKFSIDKRFLKEPPTDLFNKLSLASEAKHQSKSAFAF